MRPRAPSFGAAIVVLAWAAVARADGAAAPFPAPPGLGWSSGIWGDGADLLVVAGSSGVRRICRGGATAGGPSINGSSAVAGAGKGASATVVAAGSRGQLARFSAGAWESANAPVLGQEEIKGVAVDARGRVLAAGESTALYVWDHDTWHVHRYAAGNSGNSGNKVNGVVVAADGTAYLFGARGTLLGFQNDVIRAIAIDATPPLAGDLVAAWASPASGQLWVATDQGIVASVDPKSGQARSSKSPLFGAPRALTGVSSPEGDLIAVSGQSDLALFDGKDWKPLGVNIAFPEGLGLDVPGGALYVVNRDGLQRVPVDHPRLASARAALPAQAPGGSACADAPPAPAAPSAPPAPIAARSTDSGEKGTGDPSTVDVLRWPTLRAGAGYGFHPGEPGGIKSTFDLDINVGMRAGITPSFALWPELGYSYVTGDQGGGNFVTAGVGPLFGTPIAAVGWQPKLVVGDARGLLGVGMRNSVVGSFIYDIVSVELSHQWIHTAQAEHHEGRVMFAFDVLPVAGYLLFTNLLYSVFPRTPRP
ncbi:MAG: hypothetical protein U0359_13215 [Byssovorax sp.]